LHFCSSAIFEALPDVPCCTFAHGTRLHSHIACLPNHLCCHSLVYFNSVLTGQMISLCQLPFSLMGARPFSSHQLTAVQCRFYCIFSASIIRCMYSCLTPQQSLGKLHEDELLGHANWNVVSRYAVGVLDQDLALANVSTTVRWGEVTCCKAASRESSSKTPAFASPCEPKLFC